MSNLSCRYGGLDTDFSLRVTFDDFVVFMNGVLNAKRVPVVREGTVQRLIALLQLVLLLSARPGPWS